MKCKKILPNNRQCQANAQRDKELCYRHDPDTIEVALQASSKGGQNRALQGEYGSPVIIKTPDDAKNFLAEVINAVWADGVPVQVGGSMGFLVRCWLDAYEVCDISRRLDAVEKKLL